MESSSHPQKTYTVDEANALLPTVRELVQELQRIQRSIVKTTEQMDERSLKISAGNGYPLQTLRKELQDLSRQQLKFIEAFQAAMGQLQDIGCEVKDLMTGLIDFYSLRDGQLVYLCWKLGEERIRFWHTLNAGFTGRQPLESDAPHGA